MQEVLEKILGLLEAQDAKIKALEKQLEVYGNGFSTVLDTVYNDAYAKDLGAFSERHRSKFEPYLDVMDRLDGGDSFKAIYEKALDLNAEDGFDEDAYVDGMLANIIETINSLKSVVPPQAQEALEVAEEAIVTASMEAEGGDQVVLETGEDAPEAWSEEDLKKERLEGPRLFE